MHLSPSAFSYSLIAVEQVIKKEEYAIAEVATQHTA